MTTVAAPEELGRRASISQPDPRVQAILRAMGPPTWRFRLLMSISGLGLAWGVFAYFVQLRDGLTVTGLNRPVYWGFYMANFVFFIAISFGGTLVSAVLRLAGADWRHPITRAAEGLTVAALLVGAPQVIIDMGRPDRLLEVFAHPNPTSPILWDIVAISLYFAASLVFLYLPLIPDLAYCRDHLPRASPLRRRLYGVLSLGWRGSPRQLERMHRCLGILAVALIPIAVFVHSVLAWVFSTTVQPGWHSTLLGPYFVLGALFSGTGAVIVLLGILRRALHLEDILRPHHFERLGRGLLALSLVWAYFTFAEFLTSYCGQQPAEMTVLQSKLSGTFRVPFWTMVVLCLPVPLLLLLTSRNAVRGAVLAGLSVNVGLWLERYLIVVPTLTAPHAVGGGTLYVPTWVEWGVLLGSLYAPTLRPRSMCLRPSSVSTQRSAESGPTCHRSDCAGSLRAASTRIPRSKPPPPSPHKCVGGRAHVRDFAPPIPVTAPGLMHKGGIERTIRCTTLA